MAEECPSDCFQEKKTVTEVINHDRDFVEHYLGGVRVQSQKQFLDHDRKVLRFYAKCDDFPYTIHYFLADDTIEVLEIHFSNEYHKSFNPSFSGCHPYPQLLKRQKMIKALGPMYQPGQTPLVREYITDADFYVSFSCVTHTS